MASDPGAGVFLLPDVGGDTGRGFSCGANPSFLASWRDAEGGEYILAVNELPSPRGLLRVFSVEEGPEPNLVEVGP